MCQKTTDHDEFAMTAKYFLYTLTRMMKLAVESEDYFLISLVYLY